MLERSLAVLTVFQRLKGRMARLIDPVVQSQGLTPLQAMVLLLVAQGDLTVGALSENTNMGHANASTLCKKLERGGYLIRTRSEKDERIVNLSLTDKGRQALERVEERISQYYGSLERLPAWVGEDIRRGIEAADYAMDYLQNQIVKGEQDQC